MLLFSLATAYAQPTPDAPSDLGEAPSTEAAAASEPSEGASSDTPSDAEPADGEPAEADGEPAEEKKKEKFLRSDKDYEPKPSRTEYMVFPVIAQNPDVGVMFGLSGSISRFRPNYDPYRWAVRANAILSVREFQGKTQILMQNYSLALDMPDLLEKRIRILPLVQYLRIPNASYYGTGNDTSAAPADDTTYYRYDKQLFQLAAPIEYTMSENWALQAAIRFRYIDARTYDDSLLESDLALQDENGDPIVYGAIEHPDMVNSLALKYDTRDWELDPAKGLYLQTSIRNTVGLSANVKAFWGWNLDLRVYQNIVPKYLTFAARFMSDVQWGGVPFYELDRAGAFPSFSAVGGSSAIRGIPEGRYRGQSKILGQVELRSWLFGHMLGNTHVRMGLEAFFDTGRVWAVTGQKNPDLDGTGIGLKYGTGAGLRFGWGEYGVVRVDYAWSPFGDPTDNAGIYMDVMNSF